MKMPDECSSNVISNASLFHRPLERSWPPRAMPKPPSTDNFQFDIIDTDDPVNSSNDIVPDTQRVDFVPGEFFEERTTFAVENGQTLKPNREREECAPLATPETDGSLSETNVLRLGAPKTPENVILKPLLKKKIGPDNYISTILTQKVKNSSTGSHDYSSFMSNEPPHSFNLLTNTDAPNNLDALNKDIAMPFLKPHPPLRRQLSATNAQNSLEASGSQAISLKQTTNGADEHQNRHYTLCRKPSLRSSPPSEASSTRSASPLDHISSSPEGAASPLAQNNKVDFDLKYFKIFTI